MEAVAALFSKAAAAGRWALGMLELGVTVPLDVPGGLTAPGHLLDEETPRRYHPVTGLPMLLPGFDVAGNPEACSLGRALGEDD